MLCAVQASALPDGSRDSSDGEMRRRRWLAELSTYWHHLLRALAYISVEPIATVRDHALVVTHRCMTVAGEGLRLPHDTWGGTWRDIVLPMLAELAGRMQEVGGPHGAADAAETDALAKSMCLMVNVVHKTFVTHVAELSQLRDWRALWLSTLQVRRHRARPTQARPRRRAPHPRGRSAGASLPTVRQQQPGTGRCPPSAECMCHACPCDVSNRKRTP